MGDHGEVCEVSLDAWVQDGGGSGVTQGRSVLVQQVHQFFGNHPKTNYTLAYNFGF